MLFRSVHILLVTLTQRAVCETKLLFDFLISLARVVKILFRSPLFSPFFKQFPRPVSLSLSLSLSNPLDIDLRDKKHNSKTRNQVVIRSCRQHSNRWTVGKKKDTFFTT